MSNNSNVVFKNKFANDLLMQTSRNKKPPGQLLSGG